MIAPLLRTWLPIAFVATVLCALVYGVAQQNFRQSANDPQIQIAQDAVNTIAKGAKPASVVPTEKTDMRTSLATYVIVYDDTGNIIASSAVLDGSTPSVPEGVLTFARVRPQNRITWEPAAGVRSAIVVMHYTENEGGFVVVGRSLKEVEVREAQLTLRVFTAWIVMVVGSLILCGLLQGRRKRSQKER
jgi:hypothetical protein